MFIKKSLSVYTTALFLITGIGCKKHNDGNTVPDPDPIRPDLTLKVVSSIAGFVTDDTNQPVPFAEVNAGDKKVLTDQYGYFSIANASLSKDAGFVRVIKGGFFDGDRGFLPVENRQSFVRIKLLPKKESGAIDAAAGGTVTTTDGAQITLPANGVVAAAGGAAYTGQVHVSARWINPADKSDLQLSLPGDARGTDTEGYLKALKSYGMMAVELTGANGQLLQIAAGKTAGLSIPIPVALAGTAPASIALWCLNDTTGLWKQQGSLAKNGNVYTGTVSHFSFWDAAIGVPLVNFTARIMDASSQPLVNVPVAITLAGMPQNAGYSSFCYTDAAGYVTGAVYANSSLVLDIITPCATSAYSHPFTTTVADLDLGSLTGNLGQSMVTISGTVSNCSGQPVTNGYIQTYDHGFYNRINVSSGSFSFTGLACTNTITSFVAVDNATHQQNDPQSITLAPGANNLGALTACGASTMGTITFTIDGNTTTITEPADTVAMYYTGVETGGWTQMVTLSGSPNTDQQMAFQFDGGDAIGSAHHLSEVYSNKFPGGRGYWPVPVTVNITAYDKAGGFVSGSFDSNMIDLANNGLHTMTCTFRVRRYN